MSQNKERPVVFVVEDGDGTRQLSCLVLESYGFTCRSAGSVEDALALIEQDPRVDVLFSDIHFPGGLTGVDLAVRASGAPYHLPTLLTSGLAVEYVEEILPEGVAFLEKPYTPDQLLTAIRSVMARHRVSTSVD
ncbi:response regulator [Xanthomonas maliensis]|uniref:response regulator n=1 Tax=Xanthomonas maliensis TaxID=1321368 RepID=UPI0004CE309C|nr:response regulator [Xanthomonas maliensis]KAB7772245.1 response regulator [Xanthomonas maliensis]